MPSKILLVNFTEKELKVLEVSSEMEYHLGYLSDSYEVVGPDETEKLFNFSFPLTIYEYKVVFVKLTQKPPLEYLYKSKGANIVSKEDTVNFFKYWKKKGIIVFFLEDSSFQSLFRLGVPYIKLRDASKGDITVNFVLDDEERPFRQALRDLKPLVTIPLTKYIDVEKRDGSYEEGSWRIFNAYENLNNEALGVYFNASPYYSDVDKPSFIVLPQFQDYKDVITKLLKSFARVYPNYIPEIYSTDWVETDKYYPKEVLYFDEQIENLKESTKNKIEELTKAKNEAKKKYEPLRKILYETGDELKQSIIDVLTRIWGFHVEDMDSERKTDFREDILIKENKTIILGEIKGTQNQNPTLNHVVQLLSHLRRSKQKNAIGALILNHDLKRDPEERNDAYTKPEEEEALKEIIYIDTRVLFRLSIAILDYRLSIGEAKKILFSKGRVIFDLDQYIKSQLETLALKKKE